MKKFDFHTKEDVLEDFTEEIKDWSDVKRENAFIKNVNKKSNYNKSSYKYNPYYD